MPAKHAKSIALTPELDRLVDDLVASGEYRTASEVVRDGLRALLERRARANAEREEIRLRISAGFAEAEPCEYEAGTGEQAIRRAADDGIAKAPAPRRIAEEGASSIKLEDLKAYSRGRKSALDLRRAFGVTFADILIALARNNLPLPVAPTAGRERDIARARELLFPHA